MTCFQYFLGSTTYDIEVNKLKLRQLAPLTIKEIYRLLFIPKP